MRLGLGIMTHLALVLLPPKLPVLCLRAAAATTDGGGGVAGGGGFPGREGRPVSVAPAPGFGSLWPGIRPISPVCGSADGNPRGGKGFGTLCRRGGGDRVSLRSFSARVDGLSMLGALKRRVLSFGGTFC